MKILVCITHVPDTTSRINFVDNNTRFDANGVQFIIGPYDDYALARAVELKESSGATVTVLHVGPADAEPTIRKALAIGADDAIRVNAEATDSFFVATQIAEQAKGYDLILMGRESIDFNGGVVHAMVGELLGIASVSPVMKLDLEGSKAKMAREIEGGKEMVEANLPLVAGCQQPIAAEVIPARTLLGLGPRDQDIGNLRQLQLAPLRGRGSLRLLMGMGMALVAAFTMILSVPLPV